ncbi:MAG: DUF3019 domain-containing protein [Gammaproteobacteria bacterium]|nr:DUF3019 domain-containing protein [Gammaproteobacteria bacterium]
MRLFPALALVLVAPALAQDPVDTGMQLTVKPVLCITDNRNPTCDLSFLVVWQSGETGYYCLYNDFSEAPIHCWSEDRAGRLHDDRIVRENFSYWMTSSDPGSRLAEFTVEVLRMDSDDRRRKRRTRHVWDIN